MNGSAETASEWKIKEVEEKIRSGSQEWHNNLYVELRYNVTEIFER